jgi:inorganic pyrophosphatase/exopolyphosphatase
MQLRQYQKVWKISEIQSMKPWDFEKHEAEIDAAMKEGRIDQSA